MDNYKEIKTDEDLFHSPREVMLGRALLKVLIASGVIAADAEPTGPELLVAADDYARSKGIE